MTPINPELLAEKLGNNSIVLTQDERDQAAAAVLELYRIKQHVFDVLTRRGQGIKD